MAPLSIPATHTRLKLHWAAQAVAAVGNTVAEPTSDYGHTTLTWSAVHRSLVGIQVGSGRERAGLALGSAELLWLRGDDVLDRTPLSDMTLEDAVAWFGKKTDATLLRPEHDLPDAPVAHGATFGPAEEHHHVLESWFEQAATALTNQQTKTDRASEVRCWPHHFDMAFLISLDDSSEGENARSIGVGFSPGDGTYDSPYFYVTPWPYPPSSVSLPSLDAGRWHTDGWTGAVLEAQAVVGGASVTGFLEAAVEHAGALLESP